MKNIMQVTISEMTLDDLDEVLAIENQSYPTPGLGGLLNRNLKHNLYAHYFVAARHEEEIVGYFGMWVIIDKPISQHLCEPLSIGVKHRRDRCSGVALTRPKELGASQMTLEVRVS